MNKTIYIDQDLIPSSLTNSIYIQNIKTFLPHTGCWCWGCWMIIDGGCCCCCCCWPCGPLFKPCKKGWCCTISVWAASNCCCTCCNSCCCCMIASYKLWNQIRYYHVIRVQYSIKFTPQINLGSQILSFINVKSCIFSTLLIWKIFHFLIFPRKA